ncbi:hypothetical protein E8E11_011247 [Didymella keratinophila]|nr:hypothetical protein E8E11_011247 [Didymella keratinophila]
MSQQEEIFNSDDGCSDHGSLVSISDLSDSPSAASRRPDDDVLGPDRWQCCRRSKTQGSFFDLKKIRDVPGPRWEWAQWEGSVHCFEDAAREGCRRCNVVHQALLALRDAMMSITPEYDYNKHTSEILIAVSNV